MCEGRDNVGDLGEHLLCGLVRISYLWIRRHVGDAMDKDSRPLVCMKLKQLPLRRCIYHQIHLQPGIVPINVRPYLYQHFLKDVMEHLANEMMENGFIYQKIVAFYINESNFNLFKNFIDFL